MTNSRAKGAAAEREVVKILEDKGFTARRGLQFRSGEDQPDVICTQLPFHFEVKRQEKARLEKWMQQARSDAEIYGKVAMVVHRSNRTPWMVTFNLDDFLDWYALQGGPDAVIKFR